jgi:hypothetical protein
MGNSPRFILLTIELGSIFSSISSDLAYSVSSSRAKRYTAAKMTHFTPTMFIRKYNLRIVSDDDDAADDDDDDDDDPSPPSVVASQNAPARSATLMIMYLRYHISPSPVLLKNAAPTGHRKLHSMTHPDRSTPPSATCTANGNSSIIPSCASTKKSYPLPVPPPPSEADSIGRQTQVTSIAPVHAL